MDSAKDAKLTEKAPFLRGEVEERSLEARARLTGLVQNNWFRLGVLLLTCGLACLLFSPLVEAGLVQFIQSWTTLVSGPMFTAWLNPPIEPLMKLYVFNITNPQQVLEGYDPETEELGPYVYRSSLTRQVREQDDGETVRFKNKRSYTFVPELSAGSESDPLTVLNMILVTAANKFRDMPDFVKSSFARAVELIGRGSEPLLNITAGGFFFGYEDNLACFKPAEISETEDFPEDDDWDDWDDEKRRKRSAGCRWGVVQHLNSIERRTEIRLLSGREDYKTKGTVLDVDGKTYFGAWKENSTCDKIEGSLEVTSLPAGLGHQFSLLVSVMCLTMDLKASANSTSHGVPVTRYEASPDTFDRDGCFCPEVGSGLCLPPGYLNLQSCYPDMSPPLAVSFPHGLHAPTNPLLTQPPNPDQDLHNIFLDINTPLGIPMAMQINFQLSAILQPDPAFPVLDKINSTRLVPLLWASEGFQSPGPSMVSLIKLTLATPAIISYGLPSLLMTVGILIISVLSRRSRSQSSN